MTIYLGDNPVFRGHEEIQPATSSRIGGVKPDGTTTAVAADGTLSVIGGGSSQILPDGYTITVATDGTGDFTTVQDALGSLQGKVCAGAVTISIAAGTYTITQPIVFPTLTGGYLQVQGAGASTTIIQGDLSSYLWQGIFQVNDNCGSNVYIHDLQFKSTRATLSDGILSVVSHTTTSTCHIHNCTFNHFDYGPRAYAGTMELSGTITLTDVKHGINAFAGLVMLDAGINIVCTDVVNVLNALQGIILGRSGTLSGTYTNKSSSTIGTANINGYIAVGF